MDAAEAREREVDRYLDAWRKWLSLIDRVRHSIDVLASDGERLHADAIAELRHFVSRAQLQAADIRKHMDITVRRERDDA